MTQFNRNSAYGTRTPGSQSIEMSGSVSGVGGSISSRSGGTTTRGSTANVSSKPSSAGLANLAGLLSSSQSPITNSPQASVDSNPIDNSQIQHRVMVGYAHNNMDNIFILTENYCVLLDFGSIASL